MLAASTDWEENRLIRPGNSGSLSGWNVRGSPFSRRLPGGCEGSNYPSIQNGYGALIAVAVAVFLVVPH